MNTGHAVAHAHLSAALSRDIAANGVLPLDDPRCILRVWTWLRSDAHRVASHGGDIRPYARSMALMVAEWRRVRGSAN